MRYGLLLSTEKIGPQQSLVFVATSLLMVGETMSN